MKKDSKFVFFGKILGYYYELDDTNSVAKKDSLITPASTVVWFKENAKKAYKNKKVIFNKVG